MCEHLVLCVSLFVNNWCYNNWPLSDYITHFPQYNYFISETALKSSVIQVLLPNTITLPWSTTLLLAIPTEKNSYIVHHAPQVLTQTSSSTFCVEGYMLGNTKAPSCAESYQFG